MKLWIDDIRMPPKGYIWCKTVAEAYTCIMMYEHQMSDDTIYIDLDHDAGEYGPDYINLLEVLERNNFVDTGYFFHIHSTNPVGVQNMRAIIQKNGWREIPETYLGE